MELMVSTVFLPYMFYQMTKFETVPTLNKIILTHIVRFVSNRKGNIVGKGENAGFQHFLLYPQCFQNAVFTNQTRGMLLKTVANKQWK